MGTTTGGLTAAAEATRSRLRGTLILPSDPAYDEARAVWNAMHDRRPTAIVRAGVPEDVVVAIRLARELALPIAIRGGGHSVAGYGTADEALVIDLGDLRGVQVDQAARTVRVEGGVTLGVLDQATQAAGLAVPVGVISATGVGGLTLGGGVGWLTRAHGLTIDSLISADVVTADGSIVHASADSEPELLWGLRGGGGNFGVVTSYEFQAYPLGPEIAGGSFFYRRPRWPDAIRAFDAWCDDLPDALTPIVSFLTPPPEWELGDETLMIVGFALADGTASDLERLIASLRTSAVPDIEVVEPTDWVAWQSAVDSIFPKGVRAYWKNAALDQLDEGAIEVIVTAAATLPAQRTGFDIHLMGGAVAGIDEEATAFPNRGARYWLNMYATWDEPGDDERGREWARRSHASLQPFAASGEYVNFLGSSAGDATAEAAARAAYGDAKLARLRALKRRWDPDNVFRFNHNISPSS